MKKERKDKLYNITFAILSVAILLIVSFLAFIITEKEKNIVAFSVTDSEEIVFKNIEDFSEFKSKYDKYKVDLYYNSLDKNEKTIYHIYEYAFENSYSEIYFDKEYTDSINLKNVLNCFSLDSPLFESNLRLGETKYESLNKDIFLNFSIPFSTRNIKIENFNEDNMNKKLEAIKVAEQIVSQCPSDLSQLEVAQYYHMYLAEKIVYKDDSKSGCYLYDSLILNEGNCDAFSNSYSLLCNLSGIYCFEKFYPDESDEPGHVWNCVKLNDRYYNVDPTYQNGWRVNDYLIWFGFSDSAQNKIPKFTEIIPQCSEDMNLITYLIFESIEDDDFIYNVTKAFEQLEGEKVLCVLLKNRVGARETIENIGLNSIERFKISEYETEVGYMKYYIYLG